MSALELWLRQATRSLSHDSALQVRTEIRQHYEASRDAALETGLDEARAERRALDSLGSATTANRQYRRVLLTIAEASMLRINGSDARALGLKQAIFMMVIAWLMIAGMISYLQHSAYTVLRVLLIGALLLLFAALARYAPVYTVSRGRIFRIARLVLFSAALVLAFGLDAVNWSWLVNCLWPIAWIEWQRMSIRRKLPIHRWPKHLYL